MRHCLRAGQGQCRLSDGTLSSAALGEANFIRCTSNCPICISKRMMNEGEKGRMLIIRSGRYGKKPPSLSYLFSFLSHYMSVNIKTVTNSRFFSQTPTHHVLVRQT